MKESRLISLASGAALVLVLTIIGCGISSAASKLPRGLYITSQSKTHVHANISNVRIEDFPALTNVHALYTAYFDGDGATDEKLRTLAQLPLTNLTTVVFTDCPLVTDKGIESLSRITTLENLGLRRMSITDVSCETMAARMRLLGVHMPNCTNVTLNGLLRLAQSETLESLGYSAGQMTQDDLMRLINSAAPQLGRMDIDLDGVSEGRLDFPALRKAAIAKKIRLFAVRHNSVSVL